MSSWEVQLDPGLANWARKRSPDGPTVDELDQITEWAFKKLEIGPQGSTVADARSLLYFDTLRTLRVFFHAEPNDFGKGLVRVWAIRPLTGQSSAD